MSQGLALSFLEKFAIRFPLRFRGGRNRGSHPVLSHGLSRTIKSHSPGSQSAGRMPRTGKTVKGGSPQGQPRGIKDSSALGAESFSPSVMGRGTKYFKAKNLSCCFFNGFRNSAGRGERIPWSTSDHVSFFRGTCKSLTPRSLQGLTCKQNLDRSFLATSMSNQPSLN